MATKGGSMAWADQVEHEESTNGVLANNSDFPTLGEAVKSQPAAKGKKKAVTKMNYADFLAMPSGKVDFQDKSLQDKAILASLPTGPRGLAPGEERPALGGMGGGFRDYGGRGGDRNDREGGFRGREDRPPREELGPSRADTVDDWATTRKFEPSAGGRPASRGFGGGGGGGFADRPAREPREYRSSAADETEDWGNSRKFEPTSRPAFGDDRRGFSDRDGPRGPPRFEAAAPSKADMEDSWGRGREFRPAEGPSARPARGFSGSRDPQRESGAEAGDRWGRRAPDSQAEPSSDAPAGERPRLKLAPRSAPVDGDASTSAGGAADSQAKKSSNPFGAARPREEVLKEKGVDPVKEALKYEHGEVQREETAAEKELKSELVALQRQLEDLQAAEPESDQAKELAHQVDDVETKLLKLRVEEDDKVRFARAGKAAAEAGKDGGAQARDAPPARSRW